MAAATEARLFERPDARLPSRAVKPRYLALTLASMTAGATMSASAATFPGYKPWAHFGTPGKAAYCYTEYAGYEDSRAQLFCWTPNDGWWVSIPWNGKRARTGIYDTFPQIVHGKTKLKGYAPSARLLRFGQHWRLRCDDPGNFKTCRGKGVTSFACASQSTGLTCRNAAGHGFWIGRYRGYRLF